eukprot:333378-Pleurochrysis_carterae.AAC.2
MAAFSGIICDQHEADATTSLSTYPDGLSAEVFAVYLRHLLPAHTLSPFFLPSLPPPLPASLSYTSLFRHLSLQARETVREYAAKLVLLPNEGRKQVCFTSWLPRVVQFVG